MENNEQKDPQPTTTLPVPAVDPQTFTDQQLATFQYSEEYLHKLVEKSKTLKIAGVEDKEGMKAVHDARIELRDHRIAITKHGKNLREFANSYNKAILNRVSDLTTIIIPREDELQEMENDIEAEKERIREEKERELSAKIDARIKELAAVDGAVDFHELKSMSDDAYAQVLEDYTTLFNKKKEEAAIMERERKAEEERVRLQKEAEQKKRDEEFKAEQARIKAEREELEKQAMEQERIRLENEAKAKKLREEQEAIEAEKKKIQEQKNNNRCVQLLATGMILIHSSNKFYWETSDAVDVLNLPEDMVMSLPDDEFEKVRLGAVEFIAQANERYQTREAELAKEKEAQIQRERDAAVEKARKEDEEKAAKIKAEEEERLRQADDADRFAFMENEINDLFASEVWSFMKSKKGQEASVETVTLLAKARQICRDNMVKDQSPL